jgi:hypothetical protein
MAKNVFSEYLAKPKDSPEHRLFREQLWLGGASFTCRYYLSILNGHDYFDATGDEFMTAVQEYVLSYTCPEAIQFCVSEYHLMFLEPFLRQQWELAEGNTNPKKLSREERALILLVNNPDWTDKKIREVIGTTVKQMKRWSNFNAARVAQKHYHNQAKGWC